MTKPITDEEAVRLYPELQALVLVRQAGWTFRPVHEDGDVVGIAGSRSCQQYTDAVFITDPSQRRRRPRSR